MTIMHFPCAAAATRAILDRTTRPRPNISAIVLTLPVVRVERHEGHPTRHKSNYERVKQQIREAIVGGDILP